MARAWNACIATCLVAGALPLAAQTRVLVDQVGYEPDTPKQAFLLNYRPGPAEATSFRLVDSHTGEVVFSGKAAPAGSVDHWHLEALSSVDFSEWKRPGSYILQAMRGDRVVGASAPFEVAPDLLERDTLSNVIFYFKGQRSSGDLDRADRHLRIPGTERVEDLHGGWYDATGDYGIHLSHQNLTSYFNPQQVPLVAWASLAGYKELTARQNDNFSEERRRMLDEGLFGADFLVRMKQPSGSFLESLSAPGKDKLAADREVGNPNWRTQLKKDASDSTEQVQAATGPYAYQASFRAGGGVAIAALALASTMPQDGDFTRKVYLQKAEEAFAFLAQNNRTLLNDGRENILDDYCALLAATELYRASNRPMYLQAAQTRAASLMQRFGTYGSLKYWRADAGTRPFFHPSDAGMPVVALLAYSKIAPAAEQTEIKAVIHRSLAAEMELTHAVNNPFGYARQVIRMGDGTIRAAYFFPHDSEAAPWWQGENARIASLAAAARAAAPLFPDDPSFQKQLQGYANDQLHWILGRNPYDTSMLLGSGHGDARYMFFRSWKYTGAPGAVVNGVTAADDDRDGIAFNQGFAVTGKDEDWRWTEEWLPHAAWYMYAVCLPHNAQ
ncbi:glycoside hydrolase family 9 protein [Terriglobus aquaticus]|uniref:glycoside hydrolase family 9 protein n=1 Tax=Terriglobus aquaticus TaxID=940139 RepID=UPI0021E0CA5E|nr:glycoside hydrolase family 9 protein [Terriglobus aquaticus]